MKISELDKQKNQASPATSVLGFFNSFCLNGGQDDIATYDCAHSVTVRIVMEEWAWFSNFRIGLGMSCD